MNFKFVGNKRETGRVVIKNNDTATIFVGAPVALDFGATTEQGCQVKTTNSLAAIEQVDFFGVALSNILNGQYGEAQVFGYNTIARMMYATRSATNATWGSVAALSIGEVLTMGTGTGSAAAAGDQCFVRAGSTAAPAFGFAQVAGGTFASTTTNASSNGPQSVTIWTTTATIFLRAM